MPEQYKANYAAKFDGNKFFGGYFTLSGEETDYYTIIMDGSSRGFCADSDLDFSEMQNLKAYVVNDYSATTRQLVLESVSSAPAGTGLLLVGNPGTYRVPIVKSNIAYKKNMLKGVLGEITRVYPEEGNLTNFLFYADQQEFVSIGYWGPYVDISPGNAYLQVPTQAAGDTHTITPVFDEPTVSEEPYAVYNDFTLTFYCDDQRSSRVGTTYSLNEGENEPDWVLDDNNRNVEKVVFDASFAKARPTSTFQWFFYFDYLTEIKGIEYLNTSEVRNMRAMFFSCGRLKSVDVSHFDTRAVENAGALFSYCTSLESIDVSNFDTGNMFNLTSMFNNCQSLIELDLSNFNTSKADYLMYMFSGCCNLRTLYLGSGFTSTNSVECEDAFDGCQSKVLFTGDIPASINSEFFKGVGTADAPAKLDVPEQFEANFAAKFNGNMFYGGYFILRETIVPNAEDGSKDYSSGNSEIDEMTDLNGTIIGNVYYSIAPGDGGYNSAEGCLVVSKPSPDVDYDYEDPFDEEFKNMFTGIVIMVQPGSGTVKVEAETSEGMSLMVKIGNNLPIKMTLQTKSTLAIPYTVTRPTYVYIYAGGGNSTRVSSDGALKIYGFSWESSSTGINAPIATDDQAFDVYSLSGTMMKKGTRSLESLPKGVYIVNGRKFVKK